MRNRAKCKLCGSLIESLHVSDLVLCKCEAIAIDGGPDNFRTYARDYMHFLRIDDKDNEISVIVKEKGLSSDLKKNPTKPDSKDENGPVPHPDRITRVDLLDELETMIKNIEGLPQQALSTPVSHYDLCSALIVILAVLRADRESSDE